MESMHLNTMATFYIVHFTTYNISKKQVTHVILSVVWKNVYFDYQKN
jgi:hypothetical protein